MRRMMGILAATAAIAGLTAGPAQAGLRLSPLTCSGAACTPVTNVLVPGTPRLNALPAPLTIVCNVVNPNPTGGVPAAVGPIVFCPVQSDFYSKDVALIGNEGTPANVTEHVAEPHGTECSGYAVTDVIVVGTSGAGLQVADAPCE